jgi:hypothetical protein
MVELLNPIPLRFPNLILDFDSITYATSGVAGVSKEAKLHEKYEFTV